jgi:hypothetical protein
MTTPTQPPKPLPQPVQLAILLAMLAVIGGIFYALREQAPEIRTIHDALAYQGTATFEVTGEVAYTSEENLALRAMEEHESFTLADETGELVVYHRAGVSAPPVGARARVRGHKLEISGEGALAFEAESVETLR